MESQILELIGDPFDGICWYDKLNDAEISEKVENMLNVRYYILSKMFKVHCSDAEVALIESQNAHLLELTNDMFERTSRMYRYILDMPLDDKDDDIEIGGSLNYWGDTRADILKHIVICYATHAIVTHSDYCIPDYMRMNTLTLPGSTSMAVRCYRNIRIWRTMSEATDCRPGPIARKMTAL